MKSIAILLFLLLVRVAAGAESSNRVIGSVAYIAIARPPHREFVTVSLLIHSPAELSGATLLVVTDTRDRQRIRREMPLGSLHTLLLPPKVTADLKQQRDHQERIESSIDQGARPEWISDAVTLTEVRVVDLRTPIAPFALP